MLRLSLIFSLASLSVLVGCRAGGEEGDAAVVATTTHAADLARAVAGDQVEVEAILDPRSDPHDYEPRPSDAEAIAKAELIITSGGEVDGWISELIEASGTEGEVVTLLDEIPGPRHGTDGSVDPHWWHDPAQAGAATAAIRDALAEVAPGARDVFARNASRYASALARLDAEIGNCMDRVPREGRKLVTAHDSLGYLPRSYEIDVVGSALPALSTQAQPSAGETAELVELIEDENVPVVFAESGLSDDLETAIAEEAGVPLGDDLYADSLGEEGSPGESYLGALKANARALIAGFTQGSPPACPAIGLGR